MTPEKASQIVANYHGAVKSGAYLEWNLEQLLVVQEALREARNVLSNYPGHSKRCEEALEKINQRIVAKRADQDRETSDQKAERRHQENKRIAIGGIIVAALVGLLAAWWNHNRPQSQNASEPQTETPSTYSPPSSGAQSPQTSAAQQSIGNVSGDSIVNQAGRDINITINSGAPQDSIDGTNVTNKQLKDVFSYGYVVFSERDGRWQYSPLPSDKMHYTANWENARVEADFGKGVMRWSIPELKSTNTRTAFDIGQLIVGGIPIDKRFVFPLRAIVVSGQPSMCVATLNDNQRYPVFVLGFRILPEDKEQFAFKAPWN